MSSQLSLREKIGQLIVVRTTGYLFDHQIRYPVWEATQTQLKKWIQDFNIGGVILLGGSCAEIAYRTEQLQSWAKTPLFISADIEEGVGQRFSGASWFPPPMALSQIAIENLPLAKKYAYQMGQITAQESLAIGINWILAPITDVNNNPQNPVINVRSFGNNPEIVGELAASFIHGCQSLPILTTAKHFPGHGDTSTDSHLDLPRLNHSLARLQQTELPPFHQAISAGVDTVMTAHLLVESLDAKNPATLSHEILTGLLREKMNFDRLVVTDALIMGGITKYNSTGDIAIQAIQAGADILLMPENPEIAIDAIQQAIHQGILSEARIDQSLARIAQAKDKLFASESPIKLWDFEVISTLESQNTVKEILEQSLQKQGSLPLKNSSGGTNLIVVDSLLACDFLERQTPAIATPESFHYQTQIIEAQNLDFIPIRKEPLLLQIFIRGNPFRGSAGLTPAIQKSYQKLIAHHNLIALAIYGSPYVLDWFRQQLPADVPWLFSYGQMPSAQTVICQHLFDPSQDQKISRGNFL